MVLPQGGARKRGGTKFIAATRMPESFYGGLGARLVDFTFSTTQSYVLEFGHGYIRFFKDQGQIYDAGICHHQHRSRRYHNHHHYRAGASPS